MSSFFVQTKMTFTEDVKEKIMELSHKAIPIMEKQNGFVSANRFIREDKLQLMSILEWRTKADHEACMASPDFNEFNIEWEEMLKSGKMQFELECYFQFD
jgi:quinol monooxygenase YgiN